MASGLLLSTAAKRLDGRVAIITGGVGGIGSSIVKLFCQNGAKVLIADTREDHSQSICKDLGPGNAHFVHCDSTHGRLVIMVNNAGIVGTKVSDILDNNITDFVNVFRVNVTGAFLGTKHAARVMKTVQRGSIINLASVAAITAGCTPHAYACSKHAMVGLTRNTAIDLGRYGVRVNCVSPYGVPTKMSRDYFGLAEDEKLDVYSCLKGVDVSAEDVAEAVLYLASDESKYVNGHNLVVDGGFSISNLALNLFDQ